MKQNKKEKAKEFHEEKMKKYTRRKTCRGGKEHDYLLTIPYQKLTKDITPEMIIGYYKLKEEEEVFEKSIREKYEKLGIRQFGSFRMFRTLRHYICSVCGKNDCK